MVGLIKARSAGLFFCSFSSRLWASCWAAGPLAPLPPLALNICAETSHCPAGFALRQVLPRPCSSTVFPKRAGAEGAPGPGQPSLRSGRLQANRFLSLSPRVLYEMGLTPPPPGTAPGTWWVLRQVALLPHLSWRSPWESHRIFSKDFDGVQTHAETERIELSADSSQTLASKKAGESEQWRGWVSSDPEGAERAATRPSEAVPTPRSRVTLNNEVAVNPAGLNLGVAPEA